MKKKFDQGFGAMKIPNDKIFYIKLIPIYFDGDSTMYTYLPFNRIFGISLEKI